MINVGSQSLGGKVITVRNKETVRIEFTRPVCANKGDKIAMSRRVGNNHRLIGWGKI
jgi:translation initiation factor 2 subunit 3